MLYQQFTAWSESNGFKSWDQLNSRAFNVEIKKVVKLKVVKEMGQSTRGINISKDELRDSLRAYLKDPDFGLDEPNDGEQ